MKSFVFSNPFLVFSVLIPTLIPIALSLFHAPHWTKQTLSNDAVVYIRFPQGSVHESLASSMGTLLSRWHVLTTGRIFNQYTEQLPLLVRVNSILANAGGSIHYVDGKTRVGMDRNFQNSSYIELMLLRLSTPVLFENSHMMGYMAKPGMTPRAHNNYIRYQNFIATGFQNRSFVAEFDYWNNEVMNQEFLQIKEEPCSLVQDKMIEQYYEKKNSSGNWGTCVCRAQYRKRPCGDWKFLGYPGALDDGTGLFVKNSRIFVGTAVTRVPFKMMFKDKWLSPNQPFFTLITRRWGRIWEAMYAYGADEYVGYQEFEGNPNYFL